MPLSVNVVQQANTGYDVSNLFVIDHLLGLQCLRSLSGGQRITIRTVRFSDRSTADEGHYASSICAMALFPGYLVLVASVIAQSDL